MRNTDGVKITSCSYQSGAKYLSCQEHLFSHKDYSFTEPGAAAAGQLPAEGREQEPGEGRGQAEQMIQSQ